MTTMNDTDVFKSLAANGPWALMAGLLLWQILKAWSGDRAALTTLLGEFRSSIDGLKKAVEHLTDRLDLK